MKKIVVEDSLFNQYPDFKRGIIIVGSIENAPDNNRITESLRKEIENRAGTNCVEHEFVKAWEATHLKFGSNPNKFPPSIKSLLKRIKANGNIPFINSVVALFNYISIKYLIPCGGDDIGRIEGNMHLGFAKGNEIFIPLGSDVQENPLPGEVIYYDDKTLNVMCRRWNWRNGDFTKIAEHSTQIVINIDGIGPVPRSLIEEARDELARLLVNECKASLITNILDIEKREISIGL